MLDQQERPFRANSAGPTAAIARPMVSACRSRRPKSALLTDTWLRVIVLHRKKSEPECLNDNDSNNNNRYRPVRNDRQMSLLVRSQNIASFSLNDGHPAILVVRSSLALNLTTSTLLVFSRPLSRTLSLSICLLCVWLLVSI